MIETTKLIEALAVGVARKSLRRVPRSRWYVQLNAEDQVGKKDVAHKMGILNPEPPKSVDFSKTDQKTTGFARRWNVQSTQVWYIVAGLS